MVMLQCRKNLDFLHCGIHILCRCSKDRDPAVTKEKTNGQDP